MSDKLENQLHYYGFLNYDQSANDFDLCEKRKIVGKRAIYYTDNFNFIGILRGIVNNINLECDELDSSVLKDTYNNDQEEYDTWCEHNILTKKEIMFRFYVCDKKATLEEAKEIHLTNTFGGKLGCLTTKVGYSEYI
jgi:hypothetical protein